ncbi:MAG: cytochrome b/b6 domain-containing protein [Elusimicrobia bacterium]|nr:cytochrome b/b6 domain-containing protein [Elusimicrobiota bacterium]
MSVPMFRGKRSLGLRLWHWANSLAIAGMVATVFLRDELIDVRGHVRMIREALGPAVTADQARGIAMSYKDALWHWHVDLGLVLVALLAGRFVVELFVPKGTGLCAKIKGGLAKGDSESRMFAAVKLSHALFYLGLAAILATGLTLAYGASWGVSDPVRHVVHSIHEALMYAILAFAAAHVIGVVRAEKTTDPGLVSDMIHGG